VFSPGNPAKTASQATCATWDPNDNPDPPGCDWFTRPPEPGSGGGRSGGGTSHPPVQVPLAVLP
jgi:hypothetical protein